MTRKRIKKDAPGSPGAESSPLELVKLFQRLARAGDPVPRLEALERQPGMAAVARELAHDLETLGGKANALFHARLAQAESRALHIKAAPAAKTGRKVRAPFEAANAGRSRDAAADMERWQTLANEKWEEPLHATKSASDIARLIAGPGENWNTIRRKIKKPS